MKLSPRNTGAKTLWVAAVATLLTAAPCTWAANMRILHLDAASSVETPQTAVRGTTPGTRLRHSAGARQFDVLLEPNTQLLPNGQTTGIEAFKGRLPGLQNSWARLTRRNGHYQGIYSDGAAIYLVDQAGGLKPHSAQAQALAADTTVVYKLSDAELTGVVFDGDTVDMRRSGEDVLNAMVGDMQPGMAAAVAGGAGRHQHAAQHHRPHEHRRWHLHQPSRCADPSGRHYGDRCCDSAFYQHSTGHPAGSGQDLSHRLFGAAVRRPHPPDDRPRHGRTDGRHRLYRHRLQSQLWRQPLGSARIDYL